MVGTTTRISDQMASNSTSSTTRLSPKRRTLRHLAARLVEKKSLRSLSVICRVQVSGNEINLADVTVRSPQNSSLQNKLFDRSMPHIFPLVLQADSCLSAPAPAVFLSEWDYSFTTFQGCCVDRMTVYNVETIGCLGVDDLAHRRIWCTASTLKRGLHLICRWCQEVCWHSTTSIMLPHGVAALPPAALSSLLSVLTMSNTSTRW